ncbi:MAG TPA: TetR/AcrR family transcriptional regulator [Pseudonocardiaceae bacterium]|jgi:AcrR family transcriptional regulator|nr:TetR/AcrR family transcriptional regulator [Pseudonocardiaceae bacterium]
MPRVTQEHLDARRQQILDAAALCFARKGFHGTSMPDIFTEANLSAGAIYRYFPSKQAIIEELLDSVMRPVLDALHAAAHAEPPLTVPGILDLIHGEMITALDTDESTSLIVQFWAESMRVAEIRSSQQRDVAELHDALLTLLRRLHPGRRIRSNSAWALIALGMGTFISQTVLKTNSVPTATLVGELGHLLAES